MRYFFYLIIPLMYISSAVFAKQESDNNISNYHLVWSDEFNGSMSDKWHFETGCSVWGNNEHQYYTKGDNSFIENGKLVIQGKKESIGGCNYTSSRIISHPFKTTKYGKIEARIKLPSFTGSWPAFWMLGNSIREEGIVWPACGEIDIMEHINTESKIYGTAHWEDGSGNHAEYGGTSSTDVTNYHTYSIEWDNKEIRWYIDNNQYHVMNIENGVNSTDEFHNHFYILLNMAIGGNFPGHTIDESAFPANMYIDYVKVYQKDTTFSGDPNSYPEIPKLLLDRNYDGHETVNLNGSGSSDLNGTLTNFKWIKNGNTIANGKNASYNSDKGKHKIILQVTDDSGRTNYDSLYTLITPKENMLTNGYFNDDTTGWVEYLANSANASFNVDTANNDSILKISISKLGSYKADIQWIQNNINLKSGETYKVSFDARSDGYRTLYCGVEMSNSPWNAYGGKKVNLTTEWHSYTYSFSMDVNDNNARLLFNIGASKQDIDLDNIQLIHQSNQVPTANAGNDQLINDNDNNGKEEVSLDGSNSNDVDGSINTYTWKENGTKIASGQNPSVTLNTGEHKIKLIVTDNEGAFAIDTVNITIDNTTRIFNNALTNNKMNYYESSGELKTATKIHKIKYIKIYDLNGKVIKNVKHKNKIDITGLESGMYIIKTKLNNDKLVVDKFIKR